MLKTVGSDNSLKARSFFELSYEIKPTELLAGMLAVFYVTGYLIHSIFLRNYGISSSELLRADYIVTGITFCILSATVVLLPAGIFLLTYRARRNSRLPHFWLGLLGNSLNAVVFLLLLVFSTIFITRYEWELKLQSSLFGIHYCSIALVGAISFSFIGAAFVPVIERLLNRNRSLSSHKVFSMLVELFRYGILLSCLTLIWKVFSNYSWICAFFRQSSIYWAVLIAIIIGLLFAWKWIKFLKPVNVSFPIYSICGLGIVIVYFVLINTYVLGVFRFIPLNRGGRLPLTKAQLASEVPIPALKLHLTSDKSFDYGPIYIIEESSDTIYFAVDKMDQWLYEFIPIYSIRKDKVIHRHIERITNGFPRTIT